MKNEDLPLGLKITELLSGKPEMCPKCAGWGTTLDFDYPKQPCTFCKGQRTVRRAKVSGIVLVPIESELGDDGPMK